MYPRTDLTSDFCIPDTFFPSVICIPLVENSIPRSLVLERRERRSLGLECWERLSLVLERRLERRSLGLGCWEHDP